MRRQGKIIKWSDDKDFGFVSSEGSAEQIFVHITTFPKGARTSSYWRSNHV